MRVLAIILLLVSWMAAEQCHKFAIAWQDQLGNVIAGFPHGVDAKFQQKLATKYNSCYDPQAPITLFLSSRPATYHGVQTNSQTRTDDSPVTGTVQDTTVGSPTYGQEVGTINGTIQNTTTTTTQTPYTVDYQLLFLTVDFLMDGRQVVVQSFSGKTLHPTMYGFCTRNCHPAEALIEEAMKWMNSSGVPARTTSPLPAATVTPVAVSAAKPPEIVQSPPVQTDSVAVAVISDPPSAELFVDSKGFGSTPKQFQLTPGSHSIQVVKEGYKDWSTKLLVEQGTPTTVKAKLER